MRTPRVRPAARSRQEPRILERRRLHPDLLHFAREVAARPQLLRREAHLLERLGDDRATVSLDIKMLSRSCKISGAGNEKLWNDIKKLIAGTSITVVQESCDVSKREAIEKFVRPLQPPPPVLLLNMGQWGALPGEGYARSLLAAAQRAAPRVLWKTTTRMRKGGPTKWLRTDLLPRRVFPEIFDAARDGRSSAELWGPWRASATRRAGSGQPVQ